MSDAKPDILHKICIACGKSYDTPRRNPRKTCSKECEFAARSRAKKGKMREYQRIDLTGQTYGELTAIKRLDDGKWLWRCSCGKEIEREARSVRNDPNRKSCGHIRTEKSKARIVEDNVLGRFEGTQIATIKPILDGKLRSTNTTGVTGIRVRHNVAMDVYQARITYQGQNINLGTYATLHEAQIARKLAEEKYFGTAIRKYNDEHK